MVSYETGSLETNPQLVEGFGKRYKADFSGAPYYETNHTVQGVIASVWEPHVRKGLAILAVDGAEVIGLGCALPLNQTQSTEGYEDVRQFADERIADGALGINVDTTWYMSEMSVDENRRGEGTGSGLVEARFIGIIERGGDTFLMRTAMQDSKSKRMYKDVFGAEEVPTPQYVGDSEEVKASGSLSDWRTYLFGNCAIALTNLERARHQSRPPFKLR